MIGPPRSSFSSTRRRERLPWPAGQPFRILSIDGGGIKGIFPAAVLAHLEERFLGGRSIATCFDLVTGTSTGGILALGLAACACRIAVRSRTSCPCICRCNCGAIPD